MSDNRTMILDKALELFAARGYDAVGVQEIVEAAGVSKPTLYHYFGSKTGLLEAVLERGFRPLVESVAEASEYRRDLVLSLETVARTYIRFAGSDREFTRLRLGLFYTPVESEAFRAVSQWNEKLFEILEELFTQSVEQYGNMRGRQAAYAATFNGMVTTYIGMSLSGSLGLNDDLVYRAVHQFMHGILS